MYVTCRPGAVDQRRICVDVEDDVAEVTSSFSSRASMVRPELITSTGRGDVETLVHLGVAVRIARNHPAYTGQLSNGFHARS